MLDLLKAIVPTLLTLLVGTFWLNRFFVARSNFAALVERVCGALDALMAECAEYWAVDYSEADQSKLALLEAKIKGRITQVSLLVSLIREKRRDLPPELDTLLADLADACTGGLFESKERKKDLGRYMRIVTTIYRVAVSLTRLKIWSSSLGEFIDDLCMRRPEVSFDRYRRQI